MENPFYWIGISFIISGIFMSFILPIILKQFPHTRKWLRPGLIWYHVFTILFGFIIIWYVFTHKEI